MNASTGASPIHHRSWLVGAIAVLMMSACATSGSPEGAPAATDPETVAIGYGEIETDHQVGSVETEEGVDEASGRSRTLSEMLSRIPGVMVQEGTGGSVRVRIRGTSSFLANNEPLWVLDGVILPSASGIGSLNPSSIESLTVLKDAGDTAIYGTRGSNGVILIKTRGAGG